MALQGSLSTMNVSDLLQFLAVSRKTGLLKFSQQKVLKGIYFENGIIVGSSTNDPKEYLGQVLIHYGKIDEAQLQAAMEIQRKEVSSSEFRVPKPKSQVSSLKSQAKRKIKIRIPDPRSQIPNWWHRL